MNLNLNHLPIGPELNQEKFAKIWENSFNQGNQIYCIFMDIFSLFNTISTGIVLWILMRKTPAEMKHYKWFLLNVALSAYVLDIWQTFFAKPFIIAPTDDIHGICMLGLMKIFNDEGALISWLIQTEFLGFFGISFAFAIIYRYLSLNGTEELLLTKRALCMKILAQMVVSIPCVYFALSCYYNMELKLEMMENAELQMYRMMENQSCVFILNSKQFSLIYAVFILLELLIVSIFIILADHSLRRLRANIPLDTYKYQKQLIFSLLLQFTIPAFLVAGCNLFNLFMIFVDFNDEIIPFSRICFALSSSHTTANAIAMFACIRPYRRAIKEFGCKFIVRPFQSKIHPLMPHQMNTTI